MAAHGLRSMNGDLPNPSAVQLAELFNASSVSSLNSLCANCDIAPVHQLVSTPSPAPRHRMPCEVAEMASRSPKPLRLAEILASKKPANLRGFLREELPVRLANRIAHLDAFPQLDEVDVIKRVRADFLVGFAEVREASDLEFAQAIRRFRQRNQSHAKLMTQGMKQWRQLRQARGKPDDETNAFVDSFLDRLFLSRIGMETLTSHYLALYYNPDGIVQRDTDPCDVCKRAAKTVRLMAKEHLRFVPEINVSYHGDPAAQTMPLIPQYLFYIVCELLKNGVGAVGKQHEARGEAGKPPPIEIRISSDESQLGISIQDMGGGIPFQRQPYVWSYLYSTAEGNVVCDKTGALVKADASPTHLSGHGVGLPMSRLYAEYLGGSLHLMSMPSLGTHAYLFLEHTPDREEALPTYVNWLRWR